MRLKEVTIEEFKNLRALRIDFDEQSPYTVLVGENGSGKSNLIEAITFIFRNLDLELPAPFTYNLKYYCRDNEVEISAIRDANPRYRLKERGEENYRELTKTKFMDVDDRDRPLYRPAFVFGYYSGPSDRLAALYERHRERYYRVIIQPRSSTRKAVHSNALRRLFYAQTLHGQFALLAFFMQPTSSGDDDHAFLRDNLQIDGLDSVLFALKRPPWRSRGKGDSRFWNAEGEVRDFLGRLYEAAMLPARMERRIPIDLTKNPSVECLYLFLPNTQALGSIFDAYGSQYALFTALESTYISKVLGEVRTRVRLSASAGGNEVTYRDLSEGEQQLLLVLGLLKFTAEDETLFLLDEPDTHLNPVWSVQYLDFINRFMRHPDTCHIIMSTHDPLVFSRLYRSQVRIFRRNSAGEAQVDTPVQDPRGMGVQAILTSDLFRLHSTLDPETQRDLDRQRQLSMKKGELTLTEESELQEVNSRLESLGFWKAKRDPLYELFLRKWTEREKPEWANTAEFTAEQQVERERLAAQIADEILADEAHIK